MCYMCPHAHMREIFTTWVNHMVSKGPTTWAITDWCVRCINRKLDQKHRDWDTSTGITTIVSQCLSPHKLLKFIMLFRFLKIVKCISKRVAFGIGTAAQTLKAPLRMPTSHTGVPGLSPNCGVHLIQLPANVPTRQCTWPQYTGSHLHSADWRIPHPSISLS